MSHNTLCLWVSFSTSLSKHKAHIENPKFLTPGGGEKIIVVIVVVVVIVVIVVVIVIVVIAVIVVIVGIVVVVVVVVVALLHYTTLPWTGKTGYCRILPFFSALFY